jgi:hypothetical protein
MADYNTTTDSGMSVWGLIVALAVIGGIILLVVFAPTGDGTSGIGTDAGGAETAPAAAAPATDPITPAVPGQ